MRNQRNKNIFWFALSTLIFLGLIYFSNYREIIEIFRNVEGRFLALALLSGLTTIAMWGIVWRRFFDILGIDFTLKKSLRILLSGLFLNAITPLGRFGGEPFIAHMVSRKDEISYQQALSSVTSADLSNSIPFATYGISTIIYIAIFSGLQGLMADIALVMVSLAVASLFFVYLLWFNGAKKIAGIISRLNRIDLNWGRWQPYIDSGKERGREILLRLDEVREQPKTVLITVILSHIAVLGHIGATYFALLSVGIEPSLPLVFMIVSLSTILTFSPTPGSAGSFEAGFALLIFTFFPTSMAAATSASIIYRGATHLPNVVLGYLSFVSLNRE